MTKMLFVSAGLALAIAGGSAAQARPDTRVDVIGQRVDEDQLSRRVAYRDLDLAATRDQQRLGRRVRAAVGQVCAPLDGTNWRSRQQECRSVAWHGAEPQMALAIERARQLAAAGRTAIPEVAITVVAPSGF